MEPIEQMEQLELAKHRHQISTDVAKRSRNAARYLHGMCQTSSERLRTN